MTIPEAGPGLSAAAAAARLRRVGPNELAPPRRFEALRALVGFAANPLVLVLLVASTISAALGQLPSALIVALILLLGITLNFWQSYRAHRAARRLQERAAARATVVRDGAPVDIPAREVVPGDVVVLSAGDLVPADARLLTARDLFLHEAALTGESLPVEKHPPAACDDRADLFRGTSVVSGFGTALVVRTGAATEFGRVAAVLAAAAPETEFERGTRRFGLLVVQVILFLVLLVFLVHALARRDPLEAFLFAAALAVGLTPELLPMIVAITLARGAMRMAHRKVIVRRLAAIENFGSMDVLCCDKTGTITRGEIVLDRHVNLHGADDERVIRLAALNAAFQTGLRSPMDDAILRHAHPAVGQCHKLDEIPFDFARRRVSVVVADGGTRLLVTKGAPEGILAACSAAEIDGATVPFDAACRAEADALAARLGEEGFRVLAIASRRVPEQAAYGLADEADLVFAGLAAFLDPPLPGASETIAALAADGVAVRILTGDEPHAPPTSAARSASSRAAS